LTDGSGNDLASYSYDAFGAIRSQTGSSPNYWLFAGEQRDVDSSLYYLRARYYDPVVGRFLSRDPVGGGNPYAYAENNAVNLVDPTGRCVPDVSCPQGQNKPSDKEGSAVPKYIIYAGTVCLIAVPADGPAPFGDGACVVLGGAIILGGVCIAYCDEIGKAVGEMVGSIGEGVGDAAEKACSWLSLCSNETAEKPDVPYPGTHPTEAPGKEWEWKGPGAAGSSQGSWYNPQTGEYLHNDERNPGT
jgi:RHS repeat-associated protein